MRLPGFTAEASVYTSVRRYSIGTPIQSPKGKIVTPQLGWRVSRGVICDTNSCFIIDRFGNKHVIAVSED